MRRSLLLASALIVCAALPAAAAEPVFSAAAAWQAAPPRPGASGVLTVLLTVQPGWHVNSNAPLDPYLIPTRLRLDLPPGWTAGEPTFPPSQLVKLSFSEDKLAVFEGRVAISVTVAAGEGAAPAAELHGVVEAQACNNQVCVAPADAPFVVALAPASPAPADAPPTVATTGSAPAPSQPAPGRPPIRVRRPRPPPPARHRVPRRAGAQPDAVRVPPDPDHDRFLHRPGQREAVADLAARDRLRARDERDLLGARGAGRALGPAVRLGAAVAVGRRPHRGRAAGARRLDVRPVGVARAVMGDARVRRALRRLGRPPDGARRRPRGGAVHRAVRPRPAHVRRPTPGRAARFRALLRPLARPRPPLPAARSLHGRPRPAAELGRLDGRGAAALRGPARRARRVLRQAVLPAGHRGRRIRRPAGGGRAVPAPRRAARTRASLDRPLHAPRECRGARRRGPPRARQDAAGGGRR